ncbi:nucleotide disphospho-sugar-binding domain-containing protein [Streptomyces aureocirculatus]|uniref:nucleotide disphospho-sugar-binding domain-containing protein n=1 Tax=Streptomyces aureocirculatus TaxID=67275 RepID=UPI00068E6A42|nr:nucleotide disphospho-sugar-binding domain-containing protein [Streptomyces aureocirculatus]
MSRVLFVLYAEKTHLFIQVPLARAFAAAGHEVRVASQPELVPEITRAGLTAVPVGRDHAMGRLLSLDDLVGLCRWWRPDLVVWEPGTFAGAVAASACGAAHGRLTWGVDFFGRVREQFVRLAAQAGESADPLGEWLGACAARYGVEFSEELTTGQFTADLLPAPFRLDTSIDYAPVRYGIYNGVSVVPRWLWEEPVRPRVGFTLGLSAVERLAGYAVSVVEILKALAGLDVEVVAAVAAEATGERVAHEVERMLTDSSFTEGARRLRADMLDLLRLAHLAKNDRRQAS